MKSVRAPEIACLTVLAVTVTWAACARWPEPIWGRGAPDRLFPVLIGGKVGYIDRTGRLVLPARFTTTCDPQVDAVTMASPDPYVDWRIHWARDFREGRCAVLLGEKVGFIDTQGRGVSKERFEWGGEFRDGFAPIGRSRKFGLIDRAGRLVIPPVFDRMGPFHEGLARARLGGKTGMIDTSGRFVVERRPERVSRRRDGLAAVKRKGKWGYVDRSGKVVIDAQFASAGEFSEGLAAVSKGGLYGYIDRSGRVAIDLKSADARPFSGGMARVSTGRGWGCIQRDGTVAIRPRYDFIGPFAGGLVSRISGPAARPTRVGRRPDPSWGDLTDVLRPDLAVVELWGKWGIIDRQGKLRTPAQLDWYILKTQGLVFSEGRARIVYKGRVGYVGTGGRIAIRPRFDRAEPFSGGLARVMVWDHNEGKRSSARWGYIDRRGEWVWKPTR